jgi:hypothetical protein
LTFEEEVEEEEEEAVEVETEETLDFSSSDIFAKASESCTKVNG